MLKNRLGVQKVLLRAGSLKEKKIGEFHWSISLHFVQFRSISFLFIRRREARGHKEGEGGLSGQNFPILQIFSLWLRTALILKL